VNCSEELDQYYVSESEFSGYVTESISTVNLEIDVAGPGTLLAGEHARFAFCFISAHLSSLFLSISFLANYLL
jgi:hypothetical protein